MRPKLKVINPVFLNWLLGVSGVAEWLLLWSVGSTMDNLNTQILARLPLPVPPLEEQKEISSYIQLAADRLDDLQAKTRESIDRLREYRTALITAAVTGKIDVRGA